MNPGRRWSVQDSNGNSIYLTEERWDHIVEAHPEMALHESQLHEALRLGARSQDSLNPQKFRYLKAFSGLWGDNTHLEAVVLFRFGEHEGRLLADNYVVTAYLKEIG